MKLLMAVASIAARGCLSAWQNRKLRSPRPMPVILRARRVEALLMNCGSYRNCGRTVRSAKRSSPRQKLPYSRSLLSKSVRLWRQPHLRGRGVTLAPDWPLRGARVAARSVAPNTSSLSTWRTAMAGHTNSGAKAVTPTPWFGRWLVGFSRESCWSSFW